MMQEIYLDNNATTPVDPQVVEAMESSLKENFGNPSSVHAHGRRARVRIENARGEVASLLSASDNEIYFTSGGTEANNLAITGVYFKHRNTGNHIIATKVEHPSVLGTLKFLEQNGARISYVSVDTNGNLDLSELEKDITKDTILISVMLVNNEIGNIYPIKKISQIAHRKNILVHTDAVQAVGKIPVNINELGIDLLSLSGHKFYGPKGIGALYIKNGISLEPLFHGGSQEKGIRSGTENTAAIIGLGKAVELIQEKLPVEIERISRLRKKLEAHLLKITGVSINGDQERRIPGTINIRCKDISGEALLQNLDLANISVSSGSACASGSLEPSHVLLAMGLTKDEAKSSIRISLGRFTTEEELDEFIKVIMNTVNRLRK